jgi:hypothetical protein
MAVKLSVCTTEELRAVVCFSWAEVFQMRLKFTHVYMLSNRGIGLAYTTKNIIVCSGTIRHLSTPTNSRLSHQLGS